MKIRHFISSQDFDRAGYDTMLELARKYIRDGVDPQLMAGKIAATLFFQPSTRTMSAFQAGMLRAGGGWIGVMGMKGLSMEKGEAFEDTIRDYGSFCDVVVLRHPDDDSAERAAKVSTVPIINGGSGSREHAVGAVMTLAIIEHALKRLEGVTIGIYGTPQINRVAKAFVPIAGYFGLKLVIDDLGTFPLPKEVEARARANGLKELSYAPLNSFIGEVDFLICTRGLQKGIFPEGAFPKEKEEEILKKYKPITTDMVQKMRPDAKLYIWKPRIFEIDLAVDKDPRALYVQNEPYAEICLAVMAYLMGVKP